MLEKPNLLHRYHCSSIIRNKSQIVKFLIFLHFYRCLLLLILNPIVYLYFDKLVIIKYEHVLDIMQQCACSWFLEDLIVFICFYQC